MKVVLRILLLAVVFTGVAHAETLEERMAGHRAMLSGPRSGWQPVYDDVLETLVKVTANPQGNSIESLLAFNRHFTEILFDRNGATFATNTLENFLRRGPFDVSQALIVNIIVYRAREGGHAAELTTLLRSLNPTENREAVLWMAGRLASMPGLGAETRTVLTDLIFAEVRRLWTNVNEPPSLFNVDTAVTRHFRGFAEEASRGIRDVLAQPNTFGFTTPHFRGMSLRRVLFLSQLMGLEPASLERDWLAAMEDAETKARELDRQLERGAARTAENRRMARWELVLPTRPELHALLHPTMARESWYLRELYGPTHDLARSYFQQVGLPQGGPPLATGRRDCGSNFGDMERSLLFAPFF